MAGSTTCGGMYGAIGACAGAQRSPAFSRSGTAPCPCHPLQVKLKPLTPQTEEEKTEHSIAAERRRMRLVHKDTLKDLLIRSPRETGTMSRSLGFQPQNSPDTHR